MSTRSSFMSHKLWRHMTDLPNKIMKMFNWYVLVLFSKWCLSKLKYFFSKSIPDHIEIIDLGTSKLKGQIKVKGQIFDQLSWGSFAPYMRHIFPKSNQSSSVRHNFSSRTKIPGAAISFPASVTRFFLSVSTSSNFLIFKNSPDMGLGSL